MNLSMSQRLDCGSSTKLKSRNGSLTAVFFLTVVLSLFIVPTTGSAAQEGRSDFSIPLFFEHNEGQTDASIRFLARDTGYTLFLTPEAALFALRPSPDSHAEEQNVVKSSPSSSRTLLRMQFVRADPEAQITGRGILPGKMNYFKGKDPKQWHSNVSLYGRVQYKDIYPGIDLVFYGNPAGMKQLEYDFIVHPGADLGKIVLAFQGPQNISIDEEGRLVLHMADGGTVFQDILHAYQEADGQRHNIEAGYVLLEDNRVGFRVAAYDPGRPLIIDPVILYSTYLAGDDIDAGRGIAVDSAGNAYVAGWTDSSDFPFSADESREGDDRDVFVAKLSASGSQLFYFTVLGGDGIEQGRAIAVDSSDNAYVTGWTNSEDFPVSSPFEDDLSGESDAFVVKLGPNGSALVYSTYLGGENDEEAYAIAVTPAGNAVVTGFTDSDDFPVSNAYQDSRVDDRDVFVTQFNTSGSALVYSTFIGSDDNEVGRAVALDSAGNIYVAGSTFSSDFPVVNPFQNNQDGEDGFVAQFNPSLTGASSLVYSTYLGGENDDLAQAIAVDASGKICVTGQTASEDFPMANAFDDTHSGNLDAFVTKLDPALSGQAGLLYSTYLGDDENERGRGIAVDSSGNIYVTGGTDSSDFPTVDAIDSSLDGGTEVFVSVVNPFQRGTSSLVFSTFIGGDDNDEGYAIAVDSSRNMYVTGDTSSDDFPVENAFQDDTEGGSEGFVFKLSGIDTGALTVGGCAAGSSVSQSVDTSTVGEVDLRLCQQPSTTTNGTLYVSLEAPNVYPGLMFFRPAEDQVPLPNGSYVVLVKDSNGFLQGARDYYFSEGTFTPSSGELSFAVGASGLQGLTMSFKTWILADGLSLDEVNLQLIQNVTLIFN